MNPMQTQLRRLVAGFLLTLIALGTAQWSSAAVAQDAATPEPAYSCRDMMPGATPRVGHGMAMHDATPMAGMGMMGEFDRMYIDMMIPHHASIVALAQAALPNLTDERLRTMAQAIIAAQTVEIDELRGYRAEWYGDAAPMPMDPSAMMGMMPGMMMTADEMMAQMDPHAQVGAFCAAANADLAFIDLVIPHHQSAIAVSQAALDQAMHDELKAFAQRVIEDQQREIDELTAIRAELTGNATPTS